jgi:hypothetical protein
MLRFDEQGPVLEGPAGTLPVAAGDEFIRRFAMLYEGECEGLGATRAARKFGYCRQRYYQLRHALITEGTEALHNRKRGPKTHYRRTDEAVRQVIRHRFLDPDASCDVIAQKLRQCNFAISTRSVQRIVADFGLQKKTPRGTAGSARPSGRRNASHDDPAPARTGRREKS